DVGRLHVGRVEVQDARVGVVLDVDTVQVQESGDDLDVTDLRDVPQHAGGLPQQGGHHRLRHEVLGASNGDGPGQRVAAVHIQQIVHILVVVSFVPMLDWRAGRAGPLGRPDDPCPSSPVVPTRARTGVFTVHHTFTRDAPTRRATRRSPQGLR